METVLYSDLTTGLSLVASFLGSGINGNSIGIVTNSASTVESVASFLGSGINGNTRQLGEPPFNLIVASFLGSGINGNTVVTH